MDGNKSRTFLRGLIHRRKDYSEPIQPRNRAAGHSGKVRDKHFFRFFAALLLVVFVMLLGIGVMQYVDAGDSSMSSMRVSHANCFTVGTGCGPVQHIIFHSFVVSLPVVILTGLIAITLVTLSISVYQAPTRMVESPPPKRSIV